MGIVNGRNDRPSGNRAKRDAKTLKQVPLIKIIFLKIQVQFIIYNIYKLIYYKLKTIENTETKLINGFIIRHIS